jgi:predicted dehydrogenase
MTRLRCAVVGAGYLGRFHAQKYAALADCDLVGIADPSPEARARLESELGVAGHADHRALLGRVDAVSIATPTPLHHAVACDFLAAGTHVLVEKPIATTAQEACEMIALAAAKRLVLQVGHLERFNPVILAVADVLSQPRFIESNRLAPFKPRGTDVDVLLDLMIHDLDIVLSLVDSPVAEVRAVGVPVLTPSIDIANARIEFANGCVANIDASRMSVKPSRKLRLFQPDCYMSLDLQERSVDIVRADPRATGGPIPGFALERAEYPEGDSLEAELAAFVDAVRGRDQPAATGQDARRALELALAISHRILGDAGAAVGR